MKRLSPLFVAVSVLVWFFGIALGEEESPKSKPVDPEVGKAELAKLISIFDALEINAIKEKKWIVVEAEGETHYGWLWRDGPDELVLLTSAGSKDGIPKAKKGEKEASTAQIREADFPAFCKRFLKEGLLDPTKRKERQDGVYAFIQNQNELSDQFVTASRLACWARLRGEDELALQLLDHAKRARLLFNHHYFSDEKSPLSTCVADQIASGRRSGAMWWGHEGADRSELLRKWQVLAKIPEHRYRTESMEMVRHYERLIAEDQSWKEPDEAAFAKLTAAERVVYWMYHLRDANQEQRSDPGMCYVIGDRDFPFFRADPEKINPAMALVQLDVDALPQVIAHLDDGRPTRCEGHWRSYAPDTVYLLRYGDCCQQIFERISGHTIYRRRSTTGYPLADGKGAECKARAEQWFRDFQQKGEKQVWIDGVAAGDGDSYGYARRLQKKYPDSSFGALTQGIRNAAEGSVRSDLVTCLCDVKDERVAEFLREELNGPNLNARIEAGRGLLDRGQPEGLRALLREWDVLQADDYGWASFHERGAVERLVAVLISSGRVEAFRALGTDLRKRSVYLRWHVLEKVGALEAEKEGQPLSTEVGREVERMLVQALTDTEESTNSIRRQDREVKLAGPGDLAAVLLSEHWGRPADFAPEADFRTRRSRKAALANRWRREQGLPALPTPPSLEIEPAAEAVVAPLLAGVVEDDGRAKALERLEALGLSALPAVKTRLLALAKEHSARADLEKLAGRLRTRIQEVSFAPDSIAPPPALRNRFEALKGKRIAATELENALLAGMEELPADAFGVAVALEHPGDATGVTMVVTVTEKRSLVSRGPEKQWQSDERVVLNGKEIRGCQCGMDNCPRRENWKEFERNLEIALDSPPEQGFSVRLGIAVDRK